MEGGLKVKLELKNCDFMDCINDYEDNYFDMCLTSPPYNMNIRVNAKGDGYCSREIKKEISTKYVNFSDNLPMDEYQDFLYKTIHTLINKCKVVFFNIQMITGNKPALFHTLGLLNWAVKDVIVWDKVNAQPAMRDGCLNNQFEFIFVLSKEAITRRFEDASFARGTMSNIIKIKREASKIDNHGAVFPLELADTIFRNFGFDGMKVFDPFLGSGTTGVSAHYNKASEFVGCEIDTDYYKAACNRIENDTKQLMLF